MSENQKELKDKFGKNVFFQEICLSIADLILVGPQKFYFIENIEQLKVFGVHRQ